MESQNPYISNNQIIDSMTCVERMHPDRLHMPTSQLSMRIAQFWNTMSEIFTRHTTSWLIVIRICSEQTPRPAVLKLYKCTCIHICIEQGSFSLKVSGLEIQRAFNIFFSKVARVVGAKVTLAARVDSFHQVLLKITSLAVSHNL